MFQSLSVMVCVPQYLSDVHANLSRGTGQRAPQVHSAIEHLTRLRAVSRMHGSFSCRFLSWAVREGPPACLYAISARAVSRMTRSVPRLPKPSSGSLSAGAGGDSGWGGRVSAGHRIPLYVFPMQPKGHLPGETGSRAPEARKVPTGHLASSASASRRVRRLYSSETGSNATVDSPTDTGDRAQHAGQILVSFLRAEPARRCPGRG